MSPISARVVHAEALEVLRSLRAGSIDLIYVDPPFNTGRRRVKRTLRTRADASGGRVGFAGRRYCSEVVSVMAYVDRHDDYLSFLEPHLVEARRVLSPAGTLYVHLSWREVHYVKVLLDSIFGRDAFLNEVIWAYDFGGRGKRRWPPKHDNILVYARDPERNAFYWDAIERIAYLAPGLVGPEKAARGKVPTDVWWHTIVPTSGREKTGYPTQKPLGILRRIVLASSRPGDCVLDFFAGSGTTGEAALELGRRCILVDRSQEAIDVMSRRLSRFGVVKVEGLTE